LPSDRIQLKSVDEGIAKDFTMDKPASGRGLHPDKLDIPVRGHCQLRLIYRTAL
jgi:hypothetical protein